jgi:hypothetical protein
MKYTFHTYEQREHLKYHSVVIMRLSPKLCPATLSSSCVFLCFLNQRIRVDNDKNSAIDNELDSKVRTVSIEKCNASFYTQCLTVTL